MREESPRQTYPMSDVARLTGCHNHAKGAQGGFGRRVRGDGEGAALVCVDIILKLVRYGVFETRWGVEAEELLWI
jgi:hypothetical protein